VPESSLRILQVASELAPVAKTGGLADVVAALSHELSERGHDVRVVMPCHRKVREAEARGEVTLSPVPGLDRLEVTLGTEPVELAVLAATIPDQSASVWCLDQPELFDRDSLYTDAPDEAVRFALLCRAALATCQQSSWSPHVVHAHDWHAGWVPLQLRLLATWDDLFAHTASVLTIHNIGYQGTCEAALAGKLGLGDAREHLDRQDLAEGNLNPLKNGITYADAVTTVSETYAKEILSSDQGMGLEGALNARDDEVVGIVNGIDGAVWSPERDVHIPVRFGLADFDRKVANTDALLKRAGLDPKGSGPVFGIVSRLAWQKGFDLLVATLPAILEDKDARLVVLGSGEEKYAAFFRELAAAQPGRAAYVDAFADDLAHLIEAGADAFLMPSRYEPCGLNQMYSQAYGTVPVVHRTGGLADTVESYDPETREGTGIVFDHFTEEGMRWALEIAVTLHSDREHWERLATNGMTKDFSWGRQAGKYEELFRRLGERKASEASEA
jgi:starch synthase